MVVLNDMSNDARVDREARSLAGVGHDVQVFALRSSETRPTEPRDGYVVHRVADFTTATLERPLAKLGQRVQRTKVLRRSILAQSPDVVHCHDSDALAIAAPVAFKMGAKCIYDAHELFPDSLEQQPFRRSALVQSYYKTAEARLVPKCHGVIAVSNLLADELRRRFGVDPVVVANCIEKRPLEDRSTLKRVLGIPETSVVALYQGGLLLGRAIDELVDAVALVPEILLVVQGTGPYEGAMKKRVVDRGVSDRVFFMGQVPFHQLFELTCGADIGTVFLDGLTRNHQLAWTNRMFMYMMAGIPIAATDLPGAANVLLPSGAGLLAPAGDVLGMAEVLAKLARDPTLRIRMGARARELAEKVFNWQEQEKGLLDLYASVLNPCASSS